jgi:excinuclease ABC subunit C
MGLNQSSKRGTALLLNFIQDAPEQAGVYRFFNERGELLYVGKAKSLKNRLRSYTQIHGQPPRIARMIESIADIQCLITKTESEALVLEADLIKTLKPFYNILLKDDKGFSFLHIDTHPFAKVSIHKGSKKDKGRSFGPFQSRQQLEKLVETLQKIFLLRTCEDSVFQHRTRPCLLYQIQRCSAPCTSLISQGDYDLLLQQALSFLEGNNESILKTLEAKMREAAINQAFEQAALIRDRLFTLKTFLEKEKQQIENQFPTIDLFSLEKEGAFYALQVLMRRGGRTCGTSLWFFKQEDFGQEGRTISEQLTLLIMQFYHSNSLPPLILVSEMPLPCDLILLKEAFWQLFKQKPSLEMPLKGNKKHLLDQLQHNTKLALSRYINERITHDQSLHALQTLLKCRNPLERIEIYDNAHIQGKHALGAMVVFTKDQGFVKKSYRTWSFPEVGGDDYELMRQTLKKRFQGVGKDVENLPHLLLIDGGMGQLSTVLNVLERKNLDIPALALSKGENRNAGHETLHTKEQGSFQLSFDDPLLYFLQRLRDEAHKTANQTYKRHHQKAVKESFLDGIEGIGAQRKKHLIQHFGSLKRLFNASYEEINTVQGISPALAHKIFQAIQIKTGKI